MFRELSQHRHETVETLYPFFVTAANFQKIPGGNSQTNNLRLDQLDFFLKFLLVFLNQSQAHDGVRLTLSVNSIVR